MKLLQPLVKRGLFQHTPELIKAPFRRILRPEQLYDVALHRLNLEAIRPTDIFLCSYPKSGNTWLRFLIANLLREDEEVTFENIDRYVSWPDESLNKLKERPIIKTHWPFFDRYPKFIYIYRDPRDAMISFYHYSLKHGWFQGAGLSKFLRSEVPQSYGGWSDHVEGALRERQRRSQDVCWLRYEDMLECPAEGATRIADFLGLCRSSVQIETAVTKCSFDNLQRVEMQHGPERHSDGTLRPTGFFRAGKAKQWRESMAEEDKEWAWKLFGATMSKVGYTRD